jgi:hypothetical protein
VTKISEDLSFNSRLWSQMCNKNKVTKSLRFALRPVGHQRCVQKSLMSSQMCSKSYDRKSKFRLIADWILQIFPKIIYILLNHAMSTFHFTAGWISQMCQKMMWQNFNFFT